MKKIFALLALASVSMGSFAQDVVPEEKAMDPAAVVNVLHSK